jgi:hypothetical protein
MREDFVSVLAEIKAMNSPTPRAVLNVVLELWENRPDEHDWDVDFLELTRAIWGLSTCEKSALMEAFVEDENTGYPLFADPKNVVKFNERQTDDLSFVIYPWKEIAESLGVKFQN